jgi:hypothetical protein
MHRSSESVAAIATALAKAQIELANPEKAMVGTIYTTGRRRHSPSATPRCRAASTSSERPWAASRSRLHRPPTSTGPPARSAAPMMVTYLPILR